MRLAFKETAIEDIRSTEEYIANRLHNKTAAKALVRRVFDAALLLKENPFMGAELSGRFEVDSDLRYLVAAKQLIFYRVRGDVIEITRVLDGRQDYLSILF